MYHYKTICYNAIQINEICRPRLITVQATNHLILILSLCNIENIFIMLNTVLMNACMIIINYICYNINDYYYY